MRYAFWDFGSTSVKCDIFDGNESRYLSSGRYDFPSATVENGEAYEIAPKKINAVIDALTENAISEQCDKVLISVQMHGYLMKQEGGFSSYISCVTEQASRIGNALTVSISICAALRSKRICR